MQLERVGLMLALLLGGDTALERAETPRLEGSNFVLPTLPAVTPSPIESSELAPLSHFPVASVLAIDRLVESAMARGDVPGAVVYIGRKDRILFERAYGFAELEPKPVPLQKDAVFDLASVTKAVATATGIASSVEHGKLAYDDRVSKFIREFQTPDKREITLRHLLTHTSGLPPVLPLSAFDGGLARMLGAVGRLRLGSAPGERYVYSDIGFIVLGRILALAVGHSIERLVHYELYAPLGLGSTAYDVSGALMPRVVPTERFEGAMLKGWVHDPRARALQYAGHAGLFSSAGDLSRVLRMLVNEGALDGKRVLEKKTVRDMLVDQHVPGARVALGWDLPDEPSVFSPRSFGHEGFTGTSIWADPVNDVFVVFLSSRLHPDGKGKAAPLAQAIRGVAADAVRHLDAQRDVGVGSGIDALRADDFARVRGPRLALLTHDAARARDGTRTTDLLFSAKGVKLVALLSPEHGLAGTENGSVIDGKDVRTGLVVESLYGDRSQPSEKLWKSVDAVVVDLQDVGARFYTYSSTLLAVMRSAAAHRKRVFVLDRPNPIGGTVVEGPVSDPEPARRSFVDPFPLPVRHGMTLGELAELYRDELHIDVQLELVKLVGWKRESRWAQTGLGWFPPSPNLRSPEAALLYPGIALFETTNLSVGRGTAMPFEQLGAPWFRPERFLGIQVDGVKLHPTRFVPDAGPYRGEQCRGIRFEIVEAKLVRPVGLAFEVAHVLIGEFPDWEREKLGLLLGNRQVFQGFLAGESRSTLEAKMRPRLDEFLALRARHLAY